MGGAVEQVLDTGASVVGDVVSGVGDVVGGAVDFVTEHPLESAALVAGGWYFQPEISAWVSSLGETVAGTETGIAAGTSAPSSLAPVAESAGGSAGTLGSGTFGTPGDLGTNFVTQGGLNPAATVGQGAALSPGAIAGTGAAGAGLLGAATSAAGEILPAAAAGTAAAGVASGAVDSAITSTAAGAVGSGIAAGTGSLLGTVGSALTIAGALNSLTGGGVTSALGLGDKAPTALEAQKLADPFYDYRAGLAKTYNEALTSGNKSDITQMPGYSQFQSGIMDPALEATKRSAAKSGQFQSGNELIALNKQAQTGYSGFMTDYLNRLATGSGAQQAPYQAAGMGLTQGAANQTAVMQGLGGLATLASVYGSNQQAPSSNTDQNFAFGGE